MNNNIFRCRVCGRYAIFEELDLHECRPLKEYEIKEETLSVFDGELWYPLKLSAIRRNLTWRKTDKDLTEPQNNNIIKY